MRTNTYISENFRKDPTMLLGTSESFRKGVYSLMGVSESFRTEPKRFRKESKMSVGASESFRREPRRFRKDPKMLLGVSPSFQMLLIFLQLCLRVFRIRLHGFKKRLNGFRREQRRLFLALLTKAFGLLSISMHILWCKLGRIRAFIASNFYVGWLPLFSARIYFSEPHYLYVHTLHKVRHTRDPTVF